jgi:Helix-turn-helix domain
MPSANASPLLTREEAARYLRIGVRTLARQKIEPIRIGGRVFFTKEILDAWLDTKKRRSISARKPVERSSTTAPPKAAAARSPSVSRTTLTEADLRNVALLSKPRKTSGAG